MNESFLPVDEGPPPAGGRSPDRQSTAAGVTAALLTPPGRGALAVVGVVGPGAALLVDRLFTPRSGRAVAARDDDTIAVGTWRSRADGPGEDLVVVRRRADLVEIHCHGGTAAPAAVLAALAEAGATAVPWSAWLAEAGLPPTAVEAHEALARAGGPRAARILTRQLAGALDESLASLAHLAGGGAREQATIHASRLLAAARVGLRLTRPWRVVVAGPVNAGKTSLVNALAGHPRGIVAPEPGTTRDLVVARVVLDGWEVDLVDTAGERAAIEGSVEHAGIDRGRRARAEADLVVWVQPTGTAAPDPPVPAADVLLVRSKCDLAAGPVAADALATSAASGRGIAALADRIVARLVPEQSADGGLLDGAVPFTERQVALCRGLLASL